MVEQLSFDFKHTCSNGPAESEAPKPAQLNDDMCSTFVAHREYEKARVLRWACAQKFFDSL